MKVIDLFNKAAVLLEALLPSEYRSLVKGWDKKRYEDLFKKYTEDPKAYRIYIPVKGDPKKVKPDPEVEQAVKAAGYEIVDYVAGIAEDKNGRQLKIGKVLDRAKASKEVIHIFTVSPKRAAAKKIENYAVISRHPYDIAGMSTRRGWRSCMNLHNGINNHYVPIDVKEGTIVAYCIENNDKNINNPVARVLIKPFLKYDDKGHVTETAFGVEDRVYGTAPSGFKETVLKWVDEVNEAKGVDGIFQFHPDLYNDSGTDEIGVGKTGKLYQSVKEDWKNILKIENPPEDLVALAIKKSYGKAAYEIKPELLTKKAIEETIRIIRYQDHYDNTQSVKKFIEYLEKHKLFDQDARNAVIHSYPKMVAFMPDVTEDELCTAVRRYPELIEDLDNPSEKVQIAAVEADVIAIHYIKNPSEKVIDSALDAGIKKSKDNNDVHYLNRAFNMLVHIDALTPERMKKAVKEFPTSFEWIADRYSNHGIPQEVVRIAFNSKYGERFFEHLTDPTEEECIRAIKYQPSYIRRIKNQTKKLALIAVKESGLALRYVNDDLKDDEVVKAALAEDASAIRYAPDHYHTEENHHKVLDRLAKGHDQYNIDKDTFKNATESVQLRAVKHNPNMIQHFKNPTEKVQLAAVEERPAVVTHLKAPSEKVLMAVVTHPDFNSDYMDLIDKFRPSKKVMLAAVKKDGRSLMYATQSGDEDDADYAKRVDDEVVREAIKTWARGFRYLKKIEPSDIDNMVKACSLSHNKPESIIDQVDWPKVEASKETILKAVELNGDIFRELTKYHTDEDVAIAACYSSPYAWRYWGSEDNDVNRNSDFRIPEKVLLAAVNSDAVHNELHANAQYSMTALFSYMLGGAPKNSITPAVILAGAKKDHYAPNRSQISDLKALHNAKERGFTDEFFEKLEEIKHSTRKKNDENNELRNAARHTDVDDLEAVNEDTDLAKKMKEFVSAHEPNMKQMMGDLDSYSGADEERRIKRRLSYGITDMVTYLLRMPDESIPDSIKYVGQHLMKDTDVVFFNKGKEMIGYLDGKTGRGYAVHYHRRNKVYESKITLKNMLQESQT